MVQPTGNTAISYGKKPLITGDYCREGGQVGGIFFMPPCEAGAGKVRVRAPLHPTKRSGGPLTWIKGFLPCSSTVMKTPST